jgi:preprotein translocase subunit SecD
MIFHGKRFNIYLFVALALTLTWGCQSPETKKKRELATLRLHIETNPHAMGHTEVASILREAPFDITVEKSAFLGEGNVAEAKVINTMGGYSISVQFNTEGRMLLEQYTSANQGRKIAVFAQWGTNMSQHRWLAAPAIYKRNASGLFVFTPDASREEADDIVLGLNNVSRKMRKNWMHEQ